MFAVDVFVFTYSHVFLLQRRVFVFVDSDVIMLQWMPLSFHESHVSLLHQIMLYLHAVAWLYCSKFLWGFIDMWLYCIATCLSFSIQWHDHTAMDGFVFPSSDTIMLQWMSPPLSFHTVTWLYCSGYFCLSTESRASIAVASTQRSKWMDRSLRQSQASNTWAQL